MINIKPIFIFFAIAFLVVSLCSCSGSPASSSESYSEETQYSSDVGKNDGGVTTTIPEKDTAKTDIIVTIPLSSSTGVPSANAEGSRHNAGRVTTTTVPSQAKTSVAERTSIQTNTSTTVSALRLTLKENHDTDNRYGKIYK